MDTAVLLRIAQSAQQLLTTPQLSHLLPSSPLVPPFSDAEPVLVLPVVDTAFEAQLLEAGCSARSITTLLNIRDEAVRRLGSATREHLRCTFAQTRQTFSPAEDGECQEWEAAIKEALVRRFVDGVEQCEVSFLNEVRLARQRHSSLPSPTTPSSAPAPLPAPSEPGTFSPTNLALLNAAFSVRDSVSRAERRELARVTGLNERQVLTWFANQRQRRGKKEKQSAAGNARSSPYSHARHPSSSSSSHHHHLPPLRTVSGSSTASSASLLSYASASGGSSDEDINIDIEVDYPAAQLSQPQTATFANFASQYQVAPLPLPLPPPPATFFQPPPTHGGEEGVEVPMMAFTSPTPITASFSALGVSAPPPSFDFSQPLFFRTSNPSPPSATSAAEGEDASSVIDHLDPETATEWDAESFFSSSSSTSSCGAVPVAPAPTPELELGAGMGGLDGWMDATFYENLLSSLGLTNSPSDSSSDFASSGGALPFDFGAAEGGGLTLSMDAVRADIGGGFGAGGGAGGAAGVFGF